MAFQKLENFVVFSITDTLLGFQSSGHVVHGNSEKIQSIKPLEQPTHLNNSYNEFECNKMKIADTQQV